MFGFGRHPELEDETILSDEMYDESSNGSSHTMETFLEGEDEGDDDDDDSDDDDMTRITGSHSRSHSHSQSEDDDDDNDDESTDDDDDDDDDDEDEFTDDATHLFSDDDDEEDTHDEDESVTTDASPVKTPRRREDKKKSTMPVTSALSSTDTRDRYGTVQSQSLKSHSFASDATEERAHISSPRSLSVSPRKNKSLLPSPLSKSRSSPRPAPASSPTSPVSPASTTQSTGTHSNASTDLSTIAGSAATFTTRRIRGAGGGSTNIGSTSRPRVPGGANAKLIGRRDDDDDDNGTIVHDGDDALEVMAPLKELMKSRDMAKEEFAHGSMNNRRYYAPSNEADTTKVVYDETAKSEVSLSILDRSEVFHENAAAAVVSLLSPLDSPRGSAASGAFLPEGDVDAVPHIFSSYSGDLPKPSDQSPSPFTAPSTKAAEEVTYARSDASSGAGRILNGKSLVQQLLTKRTEKRLEQINGRMKDPNKRLTDLMAAIASPPDGNFDRHYMVRRKNACGALQVLTANASHRVNMCWTVGVLPSLTSVLDDCGIGTLEEAFPDVNVRAEYVEARSRAVLSLVNLSALEDNKLPMFHCPRLIAAMIRVINQDEEESRRGCCVVLANLGKSKENKLLMAQVPGLLDCVTAVIKPKEHKQSSDSETADDASSTGGNGAPDVFDRIVSHDDDGDLKDEDAKQQEVTRKALLEDPAEASARYDEDPNEFLHPSRQYIFALLNHLVKQKDNAFILARHSPLLEALLEIAKLQESSSQQHGLQILAHFTRHRGNSKLFVFKTKTAVPTIVAATHSENSDSRKYAAFCLQNLSQDKPCRQELATVPNLLSAICRQVRSAKDEEEKLAALHALKNLTDEPANLIPMTNTPECFATLMQVAHASDESVTEMMQYLGCDALATLSHWFRSIATSGQRIGTSKRNDENTKDQLFVPSLKVVTWEPWQ